MPLIADLHIHSPYSRATSREGDLPGLFAWARAKGISVVGSGDFTHPRWLAHLREHLAPAEPGLFRLRNEQVPPALADSEPEAIPVRFLLSGEISSIYKKAGRVRKVHNLILAPDFDAVSRINAALAGIGNIESDGRPILGLDARDLLEIVLEKAPEAMLVPAHIWTPWFSLFGSKSGFDTVEECFGDLAGHIHALETGLSSDPEMNRLVSALDRFTLISNSDCHSPAKLGREANLFATPLDYFAMRRAMQNPAEGFAGTLEFYPEEGKYHLDGHRHCGVRLEPAETRARNGLCPACGKPLTVGVLHRVLELADRERPLFPPGAPAVHSLVPLPELLGEILDCGPASQKVGTAYAKAIRRFGSEFNLLLRATPEEIRARHSEILAEAVTRIRDGRVLRQGGYDGEYGRIRVFTPEERHELLGQAGLFGPAAKVKAARPRRAHALPDRSPAAGTGDTGGTTPESRPNREQLAVIRHPPGHLLVVAGPGTGKTFALVARLRRLLGEDGVVPERVAAITFTNRAAEELRERLQQALGAAANGIFVGTFHAFALHWLRHALRTPLTVIGDEGRGLLLRRLFPDLPAARRSGLEGEIAEQLESLSGPTPIAPTPEIRHYLEELERQSAIDLDGVIPALVARLGEDGGLRGRMGAALTHLFVDEFQDLNPAQYRLVQHLASHAQVFAIGDPDQAIYGFRGADWRHFAQFAAEFGAARLALTRNHRSSGRILAAAGALIAHNGGERAPLKALGRMGPAIECHAAATPVAEAEWLAARIEALLGGTSHRNLADPGGSYGLRDIALLYRLNSQSEPLRTALERRGLPVQQVGVTPFFAKPALRPGWLWLRAAADPGALEHIALAGCLPGIGEATQRRLEELLPLEFTDFFAEVERREGRLSPKLATLSKNLQRFRLRAAEEGLAPALQDALPSLGLGADTPEPRRLVELAGAFGRDLAVFADHLERHAKATVYDPRAEAIPLMTLHAAKGLEFPVVCIAGLEEGLLPCDLPGLRSPLDEERRLLYVGITRAKQRLILTRAERRTLFGQPRRQAPSRFLGELPTRHLQVVEPESQKTPEPPPEQLSLF
jgi:DNA helicase II / ATP-dependent DNA helicase PcrA